MDFAWKPRASPTRPIKQPLFHRSSTTLANHTCKTCCLGKLERGNFVITPLYIYICVCVCACVCIYLYLSLFFFGVGVCVLTLVQVSSISVMEASEERLLKEKKS